MATTDTQADNLKAGYRALTIGDGDPVDLLVLIDGSKGMDYQETPYFDAHIVDALKKAIGDCPSKLYVNFFGIQGPAPAKRAQLTNFKNTLVDYLTNALHVDKSSLVERDHGVDEDTGSTNNDGQTSDLGRATVDGSKYYDWINGAKRAMLVVGDMGWDQGNYHETDPKSQWKKWVDAAATNAQYQQVTVYTYRREPIVNEPNDPDVFKNEYQYVASQTGGIAWKAPKLTDISGPMHDMVCSWKHGNPLVTGPGPVTNPPHPHGGGHGGHGGQGGPDGQGGQGGGSGTTTLCDELPGILKTICSVTTLLHKVVDACYPPSQWPTSAYPDGCGDLGKRGGKGGCGCGGKGAQATPFHPGPVVGGSGLPQHGGGQQQQPGGGQPQQGASPQQGAGPQQGQ